MPKTLKLFLIGAGILLAVGVVAEGIRGAAPPVRRNFTATDLQGRTFSLAEHRGKHPVILTFFATWCGPCRMELPEFVELKRRLPEKDIQVVVVATDPAEAIKADPTLRDLPVTWITDAADIHRMYRVEALPHTNVFGANGDQVRELPGYDPTAIEEIEKLLK